VTTVEFIHGLSGLEPGDRVIAHSESLPQTGLDRLDSETIADLALKDHHAGQ
jgi:hypothetical protein